MTDVKQSEIKGQENFDESNVESDQQDVVKALENAADNASVQDDEDEKNQLVKIGKRLHASHTERKTVRSLLQMYSDHKIVLPMCQRLYVWNQKKRDDLMDTIERGLLCGSIELATLEGGDDIQYLCDGLQRIVSLMLMTNDDTLNPEQKQKVLNFKISTEVVYDLNMEEMSLWFLRLNSGVAVASAVKERSKLSARLNEAILNVSGNQFFRDISKKANATFKKSHHHEIIAENILLACAGIKVGSNKAKDLCKRIQEYEVEIMENKDKANDIVEKIKTVYNGLDDGIIKRSMNANFISVLVYIMVDYENIKIEQYKDLINYIFANRQAIKEYSATTHGAAASDEQIRKRYDVIINLLNNPIKMDNTNKIKDQTQQETKRVEEESQSTEIKTDDSVFKNFCKQHKKDILNTKDNNYPVAFDDMLKDEKQMYYKFSEIEKNVNKVEGVIMKAFNRIEKISA